MEKKIITLAMLLCIAIGAKAQFCFNNETQFKAHAQYLKDVVGIEMGVPKDFYVMDINNSDAYFMPNEGADGRFMAGGFALSGNKDCLLVYPNEAIFTMDKNTLKQDYGIKATAEIFARTAGAEAQNTVYTDGKRCGGADTILVSEFKHTEQNVYGHNTQVTILMAKKGYLPMYFRLFFNPRGLQHKDATIKEVLRVMKYTPNDDFLRKSEGKIVYWPEAEYRVRNGLEKYFPMTFGQQKAAWNKMLKKQ